MSEEKDQDKSITFKGYGFKDILQLLQLLGIIGVGFVGFQGGQQDKPKDPDDRPVTVKMFKEHIKFEAEAHKSAAKERKEIGAKIDFLYQLHLKEVLEKKKYGFNQSTQR